MGLKHIVIGCLWTLLLTSCSQYKKIHKYHLENFKHVGRTITLNNEIVAELKAIELSYDGGKLVYEATFELLSSKYNPYAIDIIKVARSHPKMKDWDIEVELQY